MVKVSIEITSTDTNAKTVKDTIAYVNPEATNAQLIEFATMLTNLTNNSYVATKKITEESIG